jgi:o-succinylbenzoate synthase
VRQALAAVDPRCPAAVFALETALLDIAGQALQRPVWWLLGGRRPEPVAVNALLPGGREAAAAAATAAIERGIGTLKLKVGVAERFEDELEALDTLREAVGDRVELRLDANRAWLPAEADARLRALTRFRPQLIEEPVAGGRLDELGAPSPIPVALDETLAEAGGRARATELLASGLVAALVLKPTLLGGVLACLEWADLARPTGADTVVTHSLDGPVAMAAAMELALAVSPRLACGLDSHPLLDAWPDLDLPRRRGAQVVASDAAGLGFPTGTLGTVP